MLIVQVFVHVLPDTIEAFRAATLDNAHHSVQEAGVARFDVLQSVDDATRFTLIEAYRTLDAPAAHKATAHYARWRDAVEPMLAEPRQSVKYVDVHYPT
jgi:(4S)-4-hydroxy-5-phosphonooxypentane-2,3-dione isomerase